MNAMEFQKLYRDNVSRIYRFIFYRVGGNVHVAEDLTSEVFMKAIENLSKLDPKGHPAAWLMTVARNRLKNYYRDKKINLDVDDLSNILSDDKEHESVVDLARLRQSLQKLKKADRRIVELKYLEGYSYKEISTIIGKATGAVRVQAHRACKTLKKLMKDDV